MKHPLKSTGRVLLLIALLTVTITTLAWSRGKNKVEVTSSEILVPVSGVDNGKARFFEYETGGVTVQFFILKSFDGVIRAAFNACDVCYQAKKGYSQKGDYMVCNNCGQPFRSDSINEVRGGCNPSPLERHITDEYVTIQISDVEKGKMYFN